MSSMMSARRPVCPVPSPRSSPRAARAAKPWPRPSCPSWDDNAKVNYTYELSASLPEKIEAVAKKIYRAGGVSYSAAAQKTLAELETMGYSNLPVCIAKTQYSFSDNAKLIAAPEGFTLNVREIRLSAGAGFVVVVCGSIMTMPGLPKHPAAMDIDVDAHGKITGLF